MAHRTLLLTLRAFLALVGCSAKAESPSWQPVTLLRHESTWLAPAARHAPGNASAIGLVEIGAGAKIAAVTRRGLTRRQVAKLQGNPPEQLESYEPAHLAFECRFSGTEVGSIVGHITSKTYGAELKHFVGNQASRYVKQAGNVQAGQYLRELFSDLGYETVSQSMSAASEGNIVAFKEGAEHPDKFVLIGAHYDSVNWEDTSKSAPGAEDNGSGTAALIQAARALKEVPTDLSVVFVGFNGEEEGTLGSQAFVEELQKENGAFSKFGTLTNALIMDEVAYPSESNHNRQVILETKGRNPANTALVDTVASGLAQEPAIKQPSVNYQGFGSDHVSFLDSGFPALLLIERDNEHYSDTWGHSARDTLDHTDSEFGAAMARLALRGLLALANPRVGQV